MCRPEDSACKWTYLGVKSQKASLAAHDDRTWTYRARKEKNTDGIKNF